MKKMKMRNAVLLATTLATTAAVCSGCSVVSVKDKNNGLIVTSYVPAWPWQDSNKAVERLTASHRTNYTSVSLRGLSESEQTSTNASALIDAVVGAAVRAAIGK